MEGSNRRRGGRGRRVSDSKELRRGDDDRDQGPHALLREQQVPEAGARPIHDARSDGGVGDPVDRSRFPQRPLDAARVQGEGTRGSRQGPRRRRSVGVVPRAPGETGGQASRRAHGRGGAREDAGQGRHHALGHGAPQGSRGSARGSALARTRADPDARAPAPVAAPPPPSTFVPGAYSSTAPLDPPRRIPRPRRFHRLPGDDGGRSSAPGDDGGAPAPPRSAADEFLSQFGAPPAPAPVPVPTVPTTAPPPPPSTFEVPPPPRVAVVPPPPPARDAGASPHPPAAGPPPPPGGMDQLLSMTGQLFPNGLQVPPPPAPGSGGPGVPGRPPSPRDRGREWERGGWRERRDEPPRDGRDGPPYDARGPGPGPPGPRSEPFRAGDGWGRDRWPPGGPDRDRWGGWPDRDRDPDRPGGRPGPDRGGCRDDRAPQGPYDRDRERDGGRGGGWNNAGRDPHGWPDRERHPRGGY